MLFRLAFLAQCAALLSQIMVSNAEWDGNSMSQLDMMEKDTVITTDNNDNILGSASKKDSHTFSKETPRAVLHRAFSVFLFDESTGELLLQQRASTKITFPNVWTNTCCSHQLYGMEPSEVDDDDSIAAGTVIGAKRAAIRKLEHELGIPPSDVPIEGFKYLTRLHYWAADTVTHGPLSEWGEHEIDYVMFYTVPNKESITVNRHPDEIDAIKWLTKSELVEMLDDENLLFSPWFRLIAQKWLIPKGGWWDDLNETMTTDKFCDFKNIHAFDPPKEHLGGAGLAGPIYDITTSDL